MKALVVGLGSMGNKRMRILRETGIETIGTDVRADRRAQAYSLFCVAAYPTNLDRDVLMCRLVQACETSSSGHTAIHFRP